MARNCLNVIASYLSRNIDLIRGLAQASENVAGVMKPNISVCQSVHLLNKEPI